MEQSKSLLSQIKESLHLLERSTDTHKCVAKVNDLLKQCHIGGVQSIDTLYLLTLESDTAFLRKTLINEVAESALIFDIEELLAAGNFDISLKGISICTS